MLEVWLREQLFYGLLRQPTWKTKKPKQENEGLICKCVGAAEGLPEGHRDGGLGSVHVSLVEILRAQAEILCMQLDIQSSIFSAGGR